MANPFPISHWQEPAAGAVSVDWQMYLTSANGLTHLVAGWQTLLTGAAGINDYFAVNPISNPPNNGNWLHIASGQNAISMDMSGGSMITVPNSGVPVGPIVEYQMTNTGTMPLGTAMGGPTTMMATAGSPGGIPLAVYVQTFGTPFPGILVQADPAAEIIINLIQL